jgi:hypothetical protein
MSEDRFTLEARMHQCSGTGFLLAASGEGNAYILDATGVFQYMVNHWATEWKKKFFSATSNTGILYTGAIAFTGGKQS